MAVVMEDQERCEHPKAFIKHIRKSIYECLMCGHTSHLKDRPYFCNQCPGVHSLTWAEMQKHRAEFHPAVKNDD